MPKLEINKNDIILFFFFSSTEVGIVSVSKVGGRGTTLHPGCEVQILDTDTGATLGPNTIGEIVVKTPFADFKYFNNPEENKKCFRADGCVA